MWSSGVYAIPKFCGVKCSNAKVYCDTRSGGWTVIPRRKGGSVDFTNRDWVRYENRFRDLNGEFWIGLRLMHYLTSQCKETGNFELNINLKMKLNPTFTIINLQ